MCLSLATFQISKLNSHSRLNNDGIRKIDFYYLYDIILVARLIDSLSPPPPRHKGTTANPVLYPLLNIQDRGQYANAHPSAEARQKTHVSKAEDYIITMSYCRTTASLVAAFISLLRRKTSQVSHMSFYTRANNRAAEVTMCGKEEVYTKTTTE
jgi:hypothetical protein